MEPTKTTPARKREGLVQFYLPTAELRELRELARLQDRPLARVMREAVRRLLREDRQP